MKWKSCLGRRINYQSSIDLCVKKFRESLCSSIFRFGKINHSWRWSGFLVIFLLLNPSTFHFTLSKSIYLKFTRKWWPWNLLWGHVKPYTSNEVHVVETEKLIMMPLFELSVLFRDICRSLITKSICKQRLFETNCVYVCFCFFPLQRRSVETTRLHQTLIRLSFRLYAKIQLKISFKSLLQSSKSTNHGIVYVTILKSLVQI